jgi:hypothetical protein
MPLTVMAEVHALLHAAQARRCIVRLLPVLSCRRIAGGQPQDM